MYNPVYRIKHKTAIKTKQSKIRQDKNDKVKDASLSFLIFLWADAYLLMADVDSRNM